MGPFLKKMVGLIIFWMVEASEKQICWKDDSHLYAYPYVKIVFW